MSPPQQQHVLTAHQPDSGTPPVFVCRVHVLLGVLGVLGHQCLCDGEGRRETAPTINTCTLSHALGHIHLSHTSTPTHLRTPTLTLNVTHPHPDTVNPTPLQRPCDSQAPLHSSCCDACCCRRSSCPCCCCHRPHHHHMLLLLLRCLMAVPLVAAAGGLTAGVCWTA